MNNDDLKTKMMKLWKDTFHDTDPYISLVFDNYFEPDLIAYTEENGRLISALMGIPYQFSCGQYKLSGLYLCGLATDDGFRNRGIMNDLIEEINNRVKNAGYCFTFLIPSSDALINYYSKRGYVNSMYRIEDCYTDVHNFRNDYISMLDSEDERIKKLKIKYFENLNTIYYDECNSALKETLSKYITNSEESISTYLTLRHSEKDMETVVRENKISGGEIAVCLSQENVISGVAFLSIDYKKRVIVHRIYCDDKCSFYKLLDFIKTTHPESSLSIYCYPEETERKTLWMKVYGASATDIGNGEGAYGIAERVYDVSHHAKPYGMIRILDIREILIFLSNYRNDVKFSILVKEIPGLNQDSLLCVVNNGITKFEILKDKVDLVNFNSKNESVTILRYRELLELLFRKKDSSNLIMEAFGIPRIPINMALLLD